jgi:hypothetical protein
LNDDKSPLIGLLSCILCSKIMKIEINAPEAEGGDIIQYRCPSAEESSGYYFSAEVANGSRDGPNGTQQSLPWRDGGNLLPSNVVRF